MIFSLPSMGTSELSVYLRSKLIWARTLDAIKRDIKVTSVAALVAKGGNPDELRTLINIYNEAHDLLDTSYIFNANKDEENNLLEMNMYIRREFNSIKNTY